MSSGTERVDEENMLLAHATRHSVLLSCFECF